MLKSSECSIFKPKMKKLAPVLFWTPSTFIVLTKTD